MLARVFYSNWERKSCLVFRRIYLSHMTYSRLHLLLFLLFLLQACTASMKTDSAASWHLIKKTTVGGDGFWDYITVDSAARRLYLSHGSEVVVLNADTHARLGAIADQGIHGVTLLPGRQRGFITNGAANTVTIFDTGNFEKKGEIAVGKNPDAALYDPYSGHFFVFNADSDNATVIDPASNAAIATVELGGAPEAGVSDGAGVIFVNLEDKSEIVAIDAQTFRVLRRMPLAPGEEPTGLAIDLKNHLLFSVCHNRLMLVLEAQTGKKVAEVPIGGRVDGVIFDPVRQLAVTSNGEGTLTVVRELSPTQFKVVQTVQTEAGARTIAWDARTHHVFTVTAQLGDAPAPTPENPSPRRKVIPGTFHVLEYGE